MKRQRSCTPLISSRIVHNLLLWMSIVNCSIGRRSKKPRTNLKYLRYKVRDWEQLKRKSLQVERNPNSNPFLILWGGFGTRGLPMSWRLSGNASPLTGWIYWIPTCNKTCTANNQLPTSKWEGSLLIQSNFKVSLKVYLWNQVACMNYDIRVTWRNIEMMMEMINKWR